MALRTVFFDFGGTLARLEPLLEEPWKAWAHVAHELHVPLEDAEIRRVNAEANDRFHDRIFEFHGRTREFWQIRDTWMMERLGIAHQRTDFFDALQAVFGNPARHHLYPETVDVLRTTQGRGFRTGVISNFTDDLLGILQYHKIDRYLGSVTYSQAVGVEKPDPRIFHEALRQAGCRPEEALHVGDSWESDYEGARRAGLQAVWLNRPGTRPPEACRMVRNLAEILPSLGQ